MKSGKHFRMEISLVLCVSQSYSIPVYSHRSPLNVVHAGLDLLISEIKDTDPQAATVPVSRSTVELIQHIFSSSESAIEILNDLLQYEQMDAGEYLYLVCHTTMTSFQMPYIEQEYSTWSSAGESWTDLSTTN